MGSRAGAAGDTSTRIRDAALALFAERGVAATSLREVARSAGVAPGLVGHYFGSKDGLQEAVEDANLIENSIRMLRTERSVVLLHYAPVVETVMGEPPEIHAFLGSSRLAETIDRYDNVRLVVHGHAHRGGPEGRTHRGVPVYNVALPVLRTLGETPYRVFEV